MVQVFKRQPIVGLSTAVVEAWCKNFEFNGAAFSGNLQRQLHDPSAVNKCRYRIYDIDNAIFCCIAFNQAGNLIAAATTGGIIRLIGVATRCCYDSINVLLSLPTTDDDDSSGALESNSSDSLSINQSVGGCRKQACRVSNVKLGLLEFFHNDQKLSCVCNNYLLIYDLITLNGISLVTCIDLFSLYSIAIAELTQCGDNSRSDSIHSDPLKDLSYCDSNGYGPLNSNKVDVQSNDTIIPVIEFSKPQSENSIIQTSLRNLSLPSSQQSYRKRLNDTGKKVESKKSFVVLLCKILQLSISLNKTMSNETHHFNDPDKNDILLNTHTSIDIILAFGSHSATSFPPIRIQWDYKNRNLLSSGYILSPQIIHSVSKNLSSSKDIIYAINVFIQRFNHWKFLVDSRSGFIEYDSPSSELLHSTADNAIDENTRLDHSIHSHNQHVFKQSHLETYYSLWERETSENHITNNIFTAIGLPNGRIYIVLITQSVQSCCEICGTFDFGSTGFAPIDLISNRTGNLLLSRSADRLALLQVEYPLTKCHHTNQSCNCIPSEIKFTSSNNNFIKSDMSSTTQLTLKVLYIYQEAIQRERFECVTFSQSTSPSEAFLVSSGKMTPSLYFFSTTADSGVQALTLKIDISKCGGFTQIVWNPGVAMWAALAAREGCILLFMPEPLKQKWFLMLPNFEHLDKNREIVESESEFDDLVWLQQHEQDLVTKNQNKVDSSLPLQDWYTTINSNNSLVPYPFCSPHVPKEKELVTQQENLQNKNQIPVIKSLTENGAQSHVEFFTTYTALLENRANSETIPDNVKIPTESNVVHVLQQSENTLWLTANHNIRNEYKNLICSST